jgi:hypothetical protein
MSALLDETDQNQLVPLLAKVEQNIGDINNDPHIIEDNDATPLSSAIHDTDTSLKSMEFDTVKQMFNIKLIAILKTCSKIENHYSEFLALCIFYKKVNSKNVKNIHLLSIFLENHTQMAHVPTDEYINDEINNLTNGWDETDDNLVNFMRTFANM